MHARHILVENEDDAKKAYDRVKGGEDFAKVAKELSKDPGSSDGGDLGWFTKDRMVKEFADAAFAMKPGDISQPVKSQFGWHVIKVEERRTKPVPTFDQVKPQIATLSDAKVAAGPHPEAALRGQDREAEPPTPPAAAPARDAAAPAPDATPRSRCGRRGQAGAAGRPAGHAAPKPSDAAPAEVQPKP